MAHSITLHDAIKAVLATNNDKTKLKSYQIVEIRTSYTCSTSFVMKALKEVLTGYVAPVTKKPNTPPVAVKKDLRSSPFLLNKIKSLWQTHFPGKNQPSNTEIAHAAADARQDTSGWLKKFPADFVQLLVQVS